MRERIFTFAVDEHAKRPYYLTTSRTQDPDESSAHLHRSFYRVKVPLRAHARQSHDAHASSSLLHTPGAPLIAFMAAKAALNARYRTTGVPETCGVLPRFSQKL
jgi:hypothetical protein